jgi:hypothetical protein
VNSVIIFILNLLKTLYTEYITNGVITIHYLNQFETWLKQEGKGALTIDEYLRSVRLFEKWYTETNDADFIPKDITTLDGMSRIGSNTCKPITN